MKFTCSCQIRDIDYIETTFNFSDSKGLEIYSIPHDNTDLSIYCNNIEDLPILIKNLRESADIIERQLKIYCEPHSIEEN